VGKNNLSTTPLLRPWVSLVPPLALVVVWYPLDWLQHDVLDILGSLEYVAAVICMPAAVVIEAWSGTTLQCLTVLDQWC